ncbi:MAG: alanine--glyoxylate aminotransferase family protein [Gemmatimonadetes bacterium]|nr:alanine--glyoxylate aminotransferase family protein [Gemmatimonadota bacterium]
MHTHCHSEPLLLMTPGPSRVPDRVREAGARPMIHHRTPEFSAVLADMLAGLRPLFGTKADVLPVHGTGRAAMEAAVANLFCAGDEIVACCNGKFGAMWAGIAEAYGVVVHRVCTDWNRDVDPDEVDAALRTHTGVRAVTVTHCDTQTGVLNDVEAVAAVARSRGALLLADGISSVGGVPFRFDDWGVDVAVTASQKCLMSPPGLAFAVLSDRAWEATRTATLPRVYLNLPGIREFVTRPRPQTPGTTPVSLVFQVREAVTMIAEEGVENVLARHQENARTVRQRAAALGFAMHASGLRRLSPTVTVLRAPEGVDPQAIRDGLRRQNILVAAGDGPFKAAGLRIGHLGDIRPPDVGRTMDALGEVLHQLREPASG